MPAAVERVRRPRSSKGGGGAPPSDSLQRSAAQMRERRAQRQQLVKWLEEHAVLRGRVAAAERDAAAARGACKCLKPDDTADRELSREWHAAVAQQARMMQELRKCSQQLCNVTPGLGAESVSATRRCLHETDRKLTAAQKHHSSKLQELADECSVLAGDLEATAETVAAIASDASAATIASRRPAGGAQRRSASAPVHGPSTPRRRLTGRPAAVAPMPADDGWHADDDTTFARLYAEAKGCLRTIISKAAARLPNIPEAAIERHFKWYEAAEQLRRRQKEGIREWRSARDADRRAAAAIASRRERSEEEQLQAQQRRQQAEAQARCLKQQQELDAWHALKDSVTEQQRDAAAEAIRLDSERKRRERDRRLKDRAAVAAFRAQREEDMRVKRDLAEVAASAARAERARGSQERMLRWHARDTEKLTRLRTAAAERSVEAQQRRKEERMQVYKQQACARSHSQRCFDRLVQHTSASAARERAAAGEEPSADGRVDDILLRGVRVMSPAPIRLQAGRMSAPWRLA